MGKTQFNAEPGIPQIITEREFDAPRELLFRAWTEPELLAQWLGPRNLTMEIDRYDVRDGGTWRYVQRDEEGNEYAFHGVFHGDPSPDGMVQTFEYEGFPGHVSLDTLTFEERDGKTIARTNTVFQTIEARDGMMQSGMEYGVDDGYDRLDELIAKLAPVG
jgi:uncharacterized protein YndB with AHSA1/START domain